MDPHHAFLSLSSPLPSVPSRASAPLSTRTGEYSARNNSIVSAGKNGLSSAMHL